MAPLRPGIVSLVEPSVPPVPPASPIRPVLPAPPPKTGPRTETTNEKGVATFQWDTGNANATSTLSLSEQLQDGYEFVDAACNVTQTTRRGSRIRRRLMLPTPTGEVTVGPNQYASCTVRNRIRPGTIEIEKNATPESSLPFSFSGSLGDFTLIDNSAGDAPATIVWAAETFTLTRFWLSVAWA